MFLLCELEKTLRSDPGAFAQGGIAGDRGCWRVHRSQKGTTQTKAQN